jgi:competence protein ComEA
MRSPADSRQRIDRLGGGDLPAVSDVPDPPDVPCPPPRVVSRAAAGAAALVAMVALLVAVPRILSSGAEVAPLPPRAPTLATASAALSATPSAAPSTVYVHVAGQVRRPGLVRLAPGARVADALAKAGGATGRADLAAVNLARAVVDGEQVFVPSPGEPPPAAAGPAGSGPAGSGPAASAGPVDLNTADETALDALPGVGPVIAGRIVEWRTKNGNFTSVEELTEVPGIGEATLEKLRPLVRT